MHRRCSARDDPGGRGEEGLITAPVAVEGAMGVGAGWVAEDSELEVVVVVVEEVELAVRARALVLAPLVVVAGDLGEVLVLERPGECKGTQSQGCTSGL